MKQNILTRTITGTVLGMLMLSVAMPALAIGGPQGGTALTNPAATPSHTMPVPTSGGTPIPPTAVVNETVVPVGSAQATSVSPTPSPKPKLSSKIGAVNLEVAQKNFKGAIDKLREVRKVPQASANALEQRKQVLLHLIDTLIERGRVLEEKVKALSPPRGELEESILQEIAADRVSLEGYKVKVTNATTFPQLKSLAKEIQDNHKDFTNKKVRRLLLVIFFGRLEKEHTKKLEDRAGRIEKKLDELEGQGENVSALRAKLAEAEAMIAGILATIKEKRIEVNQSEISEVRLEQLRDVLEDIKTQIRNVHKIFQEIYKGIENL